MKERPILFKAEMVHALLNGSKTQTRRLVKNPYDSVEWTIKPAVSPRYHAHTHDWWLPNATMPAADLKCPYGNVGDQLWVRETFSGDKNNFAYRSDAVCGGMGYDGDGQKIFMKHGYVLDESCKQTYSSNFQEGFNTYGLGHFSGKWKPSIFMPRWASRIQLEIINVRVERLNDCSEYDAAAEGVEVEEITKNGNPIYKNYDGGLPYVYAAQSYKTLWESINGAGSWEENPWIWVIEFKVVK